MVSLLGLLNGTNVTCRGFEVILLAAEGDLALGAALGGELIEVEDEEEEEWIWAGAAAEDGVDLCRGGMVAG